MGALLQASIVFWSLIKDQGFCLQLHFDLKSVRAALACILAILMTDASPQFRSRFCVALVKFL